MLLAKRAQIRGTTLLSRSEEYKTRLCSDFWSTHQENFHSSKISPVIDSVFSIREVHDAHKYMATNANIGKIVLKHDF